MKISEGKRCGKVRGAGVCVWDWKGWNGDRISRLDYKLNGEKRPI